MYGGMYVKCMYVSYSIILYLYIYIALLAVHTNQKRFHGSRDPERREQSWGNEKRHLAHQLIKWIVLINRYSQIDGRGVRKRRSKVAETKNKEQHLRHWVRTKIVVALLARRRLWSSHSYNPLTIKPVHFLSFEHNKGLPRFNAFPVRLYL